MTVDGREDLFHYTYLNANGYLNKFRNALNLPSLSLPLLASLLKTYKSRTRMAGFIVANKDGKQCLYDKEILNKILGMSNDGHFYLKPEQNPDLQMLHRFIDEWDMKAVEKENQPHYDIPSYQNDDEDMQKVSDKLIHNDNYEELNESNIKKRVFNLKVENVFSFAIKNEIIVKAISINGDIYYINDIKDNINFYKNEERYAEHINVKGIITKNLDNTYTINKPKVELSDIVNFNDGDFSKLHKFPVKKKNTTLYKKEKEMNKKYSAYTKGKKYDLQFDDGFEKPKKRKRMKNKNIYITESQFNELKQRLSESYFVEPDKVKIVENFLDDTFVKGAVPSIGEDGYAKPIFIVGMKIPYSDKFKNMTATQAFYMLQDKFKNIYSDPKQRDSFLKKVLVDWYNGKISKHGLLSINNY